MGQGVVSKDVVELNCRDVVTSWC